MLHSHLVFIELFEVHRINIAWIFFVVPGSFDEHVKMEAGLSPSPAHTCSASLKDWFSLSQGEQPVETCGVSQSEMTSCSISSSFSDPDGNMMAFNPVNCDVDTVSKQDDKIIDSKCMHLIY